MGDGGLGFGVRCGVWGSGWLLLFCLVWEPVVVVAAFGSGLSCLGYGGGVDGAVESAVEAVADYSS